MNREWMPVVAGVFELVAAVTAVIGGAMVTFAVAVVNTVPEIRNDPEVPLELITALLAGAAIFVWAFALVAFVGGVCGVRRRAWGWSLAGSVAAIFILAPLGILALVLTLVGEKEFGRRAGSAESGRYGAGEAMR